MKVKDVLNGKFKEYSANAEKAFRYIFIVVASTLSLQLALFFFNPDRFDHLIVIYVLFTVLIQMSELELFQLLHRLCGPHSLSVLSMLEKRKTHLFKRA